MGSVNAKVPLGYFFWKKPGVSLGCNMGKTFIAARTSEAIADDESVPDIPVRLHNATQLGYRGS